MMTNYYPRSSSLDCPECGGRLGVTLKRESTSFKYWHECQGEHDEDGETCGFSSPTKKTPRADSLDESIDDAEDALYDKDQVNQLADLAAEYADEHPAF